MAWCIADGGTSYATALASASAALVWSAHPDWTANRARPDRDGRWPHGRRQAQRLDRLRGDPPAHGPAGEGGQPGGP
ncbi:S8 family serine peptidase [Streptomyces sp. NPDC058674]|uniref:S8 family serine peptidase n=1 Tax=Streptomyces sp. NPDC058674 TaxID=3346592 RepID=UPI00365AA3B8